MAAAIGASRATVINYELGRRIPSADMVGKIAEALQVPLAYLMGEADDTPARKEDRVIPIDQEDLVRIPILDANTKACAGAGNGLDYADFYSTETVLVHRSTFKVIDPARMPFAIRVEGDSMEGVGVVDGCLAVVNPAEETLSGEIALISYDGLWSVKGLLFKPDGSIDLLATGAPAIAIDKEIVADPSWFRVIGKVVDTVIQRKPKKFF